MCGKFTCVDVAAPALLCKSASEAVLVEFLWFLCENFCLPCFEELKDLCCGRAGLFLHFFSETSFNLGN